MTLKELRQAVADLKKQGRAKTAEYNTLRAKVREAGDDAEEADVAALETLDTEISALEAQLDDAQSQLDDALVARERERAFAESEAPRSAANSVFTNEPNPIRTHGFVNMAEFANAVVQAQTGGGFDDRLNGPQAGPNAAPTNYHQERGDAAAGGFMVPPQFREAIYELVFAEPDLLTYCTREPTAGNQVKIITDETTPWGATGVQANWRGEGDQMTASKIADKETSVDLHQLYAFCSATDDLLSDAPRLASRLSRQAARAIRWKASDAIMNGTGSGQPDGYFGHSSEVTVAKESGQSADTIVTANILKMFARSLNPTRSVWLAHQSILPQLGVLTIGNQPVWTSPNQGMQNAPGGLLLGRPIIFSNHAKVLGDKGDLQLLDLEGYYLAEKSTGISFAESMHLYFDYGMQAFRWTFRLGGRPFTESAVSPANGSDTLSHFVQLAERA